MPYSNYAPSRKKCSRHDTSITPTWPPEALVAKLLERGGDGDLAEAEAAIDRMENLPVDFRWAARDIAVLRLRAPLSQSRGEEAAYQDLAQRYRNDGDITWL